MALGGSGHYKKLNGVLRYSQGSRHDGWSVTGMAYKADWTATDQVPLRATTAARSTVSAA